MNMRSVFRFHGTGISWYPGHMVKATRWLEARLQRVDVVLEVRDARIPWSSANFELDARVFRTKPRIILFNKADLIEEADRTRLGFQIHERANTPSLFTTANTGVNCKKLLRKVRDAVEDVQMNSTRKRESFNVLVAGMPNVGKSTLINHLRHYGIGKGSGATTGALPGVTRGISRFKISERPLIYCLDSPGIMVPRFSSLEAGLKLSLVSSIKDGIISPVVLADFLLFLLNRGEHFEYLHRFGLEEPTDDVEFLLQHVGSRIGALEKGAKINVDKAAAHILKHYRKGNLGKFILPHELPSEQDDDFLAVHANDARANMGTESAGA